MRFEIESIPAIISPAEVTAVVLDDPSTDARQLLDSGIRAAQSGNRAEARADLLRCTELDPEIESAWLWLASISEYPEELLEYLEHVLSINPENQRALEWRAATNSLLSKTFVQRGADAADSNDKELASDHFVKALEYDKRNAVAWMWLATLSESDEGKLLYIEKALSIDPQFEDARTAYEMTLQGIVANKLAHARSAAVSGMLDEANDVLRSVVENDPACTEAWKLLAIFSVNIGEKVEAYSKLVELDPNDIASAAALESLKHLAFEVPVNTHQETRPVSAESEGLSMAIAEVVRCEADAAPEKTPTEELAMPTGVEEAFGVINTSPADNAEDTEPGLYTAAYTDPEAPESAITVGDNVQVSDEDPEYSTNVEVFETTVNEMSGEFLTIDTPDAAYLETAYEHANFGGQEEDRDPTLKFNDESPAPMEVSDHEFYTSPATDTSEVNEYAEDIDDAEIAVEIPEYRTDAVSVDYGSSEHQHESVADNADGYQLPSYSESWEEREPVEAYGGIPMPGFDLEAPDEQAVNPYATVVVAAEPSASSASACPYCGTSNDTFSVSCSGCMAVLTLSDLEMLLSNPNVDRAVMAAAIESLEMEKTLREFGERELTTLGIGHLNLRNFDAGYAYLEQASKLNPTNVVLAGQVNILHIRLAEIRAKEEAHSSMVKGKTILVVDDSPTILRLIAGKLEKCGHDVYCSENGEEAMEWLKGMVPDLVLLDINMPKMDGYQVCKLIRSNEPTKDVPVVMISGKDGFFDKVRGRMAGTSGYITKPFGPETLMKIVEGYLKGEPVSAE